MLVKLYNIFKMERHQVYSGNVPHVLSIIYPDLNIGKTDKHRMYSNCSVSQEVVKRTNRILMCIIFSTVSQFIQADT